MMITLTHRLDRRIVIHARPATVFEFFTNSGDWAEWWGPGSTIDARPGGHVLIRYPNGIEVSGTVVDVVPPERMVFTYGYVSGTPIPAGASRVTIRLGDHAAGTVLHLTHEFDDEAVRDQHVQGWRFQLSVLVNAVANRANGSAAARIDQWFQAWSDPDVAARERTLSEISTAALTFRDRFSVVSGGEDVRAHLASVHRFMPGMRLERRGEIRHCQWHVLADWVALTVDGQERGRGTNLFHLDADGRIAEVIGFWT
jgi:uncharacterized protein YndB with AHSA1/START domain